MYIMQDVCPEISNPEQDPAACEPDTDNMAGKSHTTLRGLLRLVINKDNLLTSHVRIHNVMHDIAF